MSEEHPKPNSPPPANSKPPSPPKENMSSSTRPLPPSSSSSGGDSLPPPPPPPVARVGGSSSSTSRRTRSRSHSRERSRTQPDIPNTIHGGAAPPPSYGAPPLPYGGYPLPQYPNAAPPPQQHHYDYNQHSWGSASQGRQRAWSGDYGQLQNLYQGQPPPSGGHRRAESMGGGGGGSGGGGSHRRLDSNGSVGSYYGAIPPASPRAPASPRSQEFNARSEFLNVTGIRPPDSPRHDYARQQQQQQQQQQSYRQMSPVAQYSPRGGGAAAPYSPGLAGMSLIPDLNAGSGQPSPAHSYRTGGSPFTTGSERGGVAAAAAGGEAVFLARRQASSKGIGNSSGDHSSRRRHMRQQSAQLYIQEIKGQPQPLVCRDLVFLLLFAFHLTGMVYLSNTYSYEAMQTNDGSISTIVPGYNLTTGNVTSYTTTNATTTTVTDTNGTLIPTQTTSSEKVLIDYSNLLNVALLSGAFAIAVSTLLLGVMAYSARRFLQVALCVIITLSFVWGTVGIGLSPKNVVPITGIIALALSVAYTIIVWDRVPFAASNLITALTAIRAFPGTIVVALCFQALGMVWCIYYAMIVMGIYDSILVGRIVLSPRMTIAAYVALGVSFYWTYQVLLNAVQVATAGVIGAWWSHPDGDHTVKTTSFKTLFYSMGSVCFGSLFVGPVRVIRQVSVLFRPSTDEASLLCLHECLQCLRTCITRCVDALAARFNPWAFTYVGLYSYGFLEAGQMATDLFDKRGWTTIVSDDLVPNVLLMTSLVVGGVTGCFGYMMAGLEEIQITPATEPGLVSFGIGIVLGLVATSILFGAIGGSVNAVIVCFATSPADFELNHPELSHNMRAAWREVWPGALDMVDMRLAMAQVMGGGPPPPPYGSMTINGEITPLV